VMIIILLNKNSTRYPRTIHFYLTQLRFVGIFRGVFSTDFYFF
jgi:hypothetical protein